MKTLDNFLNESKNAEFVVQLYQDGLPSKYGREEDLDIEGAVGALMYYDEVSDKYDEEQIEKIVSKLKKSGEHTFGSRWTEIRVTRIK